MIPSDSIPVIEFITASERNLRVAEAAYKHYETARREILSRFFDRLSTTLLASLRGWQSSYRVPFFTERYGAFDVWKPAWKARYSVRVEAFGWGERMLYGLWRDSRELGGSALLPKVLTTVKGKVPSAKSRSWYEAEIIMRSPAADWRPPEVLWRLHTDETFLCDVAEQMLEVARLTERMIDAAVAKLDRT